MVFCLLLEKPHPFVGAPRFDAPAWQWQTWKTSENSNSESKFKSAMTNNLPPGHTERCFLLRWHVDGTDPVLYWSKEKRAIGQIRNGKDTRFYVELTVPFDRESDEEEYRKGGDWRPPSLFGPLLGPMLLQPLWRIVTDYFNFDEFIELMPPTHWAFNGIVWRPEATTGPFDAHITLKRKNPQEVRHGTWPYYSLRLRTLVCLPEPADA